MSSLAEPGEIEGCFVVEVGERGAWPFLTLCDGRGQEDREVRLYLDSSWVVDVSGSTRRSSVSEEDDMERLGGLFQLVGQTVETVRISPPGDLEIRFAGGARMTVSGTAAAETAGEPWWLSAWRRS
jgi:uncharacterized protein DUF6188